MKRISCAVLAFTIPIGLSSFAFGGLQGGEFDPPRPYHPAFSIDVEGKTKVFIKGEAKSDMKVAATKKKAAKTKKKK